MSKTWFIADTHFCDNKIIDYENRPFRNSSVMNRQLIENWNNKIDQSDRVFVLGDYMYFSAERSAREVDQLYEITKQLNGNKRLIMGNHDKHMLAFYKDAGFDWVSKWPIILNNFFILSHEPMYVNKNMPYANIFGHVHGNTTYKDYSPQSVCVSVERPHMNYAPIELSEIKELLKKEEY